MTAYRLAAGTVTEKALLADSSNIITSFPVQSDQIVPTFAWLAASDDIIQPYATRIQALDKSVGRFGNSSTILRFGVLTQEMWAYLDTTFFGKVAATDTLPTESALVTVYLRDRVETGTLELKAYSATMIRPPIEFDAVHPHAGIYQTDVAFELVGMTIASAGVAFTLGFTIGFDA